MNQTIDLSLRTKANPPLRRKMGSGKGKVKVKERSRVTVNRLRVDRQTMTNKRVLSFRLLELSQKKKVILL